jgi:hypothetical protein
LRSLDPFILSAGLRLRPTSISRGRSRGEPSASSPSSRPASRSNPEALKYLNRLSDHLFVLGRRVNDGGAREVLWRPGANR